MHSTRRRDLGRLVGLGVALLAVAAPCGAQEVFSDGFESGGTGGWTEVVGLVQTVRQVVFEGFFNPG